MQNRRAANRPRVNEITARQPAVAHGCHHRENTVGNPRENGCESPQEPLTSRDGGGSTTRPGHLAGCHGRYWKIRLTGACKDDQVHPPAKLLSAVAIGCSARVCCEPECPCFAGRLAGREDGRPCLGEETVERLADLERESTHLRDHRLE